MIQESLINCVGERRRSGITSHCEVIPGFCLSPSYPEVELAIAEMACVSRNIRTAVPAAYGIPVQRSISERDGSYPSEVEFEKA